MKTKKETNNIGSFNIVIYFEDGASLRKYFTCGAKDRTLPVVIR